MAQEWAAVARSQQLDLYRLNRSITNRELARILRDAAEEAAETAARLSAMSGVGAQTRAAQLRLAQAGARDISRQLWNRADKQIRAGIFDSVNLAMMHTIELDVMVGMPAEMAAMLRSGLPANVGRTAEAIIARNQYGHTLSQRVYRNQALSSGKIYQAIDKGLAQRLSARELASSVRHLVSPSTPGGVSYSAMRLARTEINNSYHFVTRDRYASRPWVDMVKWELSGSHGAPDECDDLQHEGPYQPDHAPDRPHPHCLCYLTPITVNPSEFEDALFSGAYDDWLMSEGMEGIL